MNDIKSLFILILLILLQLVNSCCVNQQYHIAVIDTQLSRSFQLKHQINICVLPLVSTKNAESITVIEQFKKNNEDNKNKEESQHPSLKDMHGELIVTEILKINPSAKIVYFEASKNNANKNNIEEDFIYKSFKKIEECLWKDSKSIKFINLSIGSQEKSQKLQNIIDRILFQYPNLIIFAASGNSGPWRGSVQFPSSLLSVLSIGTTSALSSRGPQIEPFMTTLIKPDFIIDINNILSEQKADISEFADIEICNGTSIATARITGFMSKQNKKDYSRAKMILSLIHSSYCIEGYSQFEQGFGLLDMEQDISFIQFSPFVYLFPTFLDLTETNDYFEINQNLLTHQEPRAIMKKKISIAYSLFLLNIYFNKIILVDIFYKYPNETCPFRIQVEDNTFEKLQNYMRINIITDETPNQLIQQCTFIFEFQVRNIFTNKVLKKSEKIELVLKAMIDQGVKPQYNILLNSFYQQDCRESLNYKSNYQQKLYKNTFECYGGSSQTNYFELKRYINDKYSRSNHVKIYFLEMYGQFEELDDLQNTLIIIADYERPLSKKDIEFLQNHLEYQNNSLIIFGEWFKESLNSAISSAFEYESINDFLKLYGVQFLQGSFSSYNLEFNSYKTIYLSGCQIQIDSRQSEKLVREIQIKKASFQDDLVKTKEEDIIFYAKITLASQSSIYLFGDSACLEEVFEQDNCYFLIENIIDSFLHDEKTSKDNQQ